MGVPAVVSDRPRETPLPTGPSQSPTVTFQTIDIAASRPRARSLRPRSLHAFLPGETVAGRFRVARFLGQGGMGQVFAAEDLALGDTVALKVIHPAFASDEIAVRRFKREVQLARQVTHPNVCRIFDLFFHSGRSAETWGRSRRPTLVLTMEMLSGETLSRRLARGPLTAAEALPLIGQIAEALDAAHRANVVHRDFKSGNVLLVPASGGIRAVVTDFGLAVPAAVAAQPGPAAAPLAAFSGTPEYVAPEVLTGEDVTPAADLYSFGVVIYEMLTDSLPFQAETPQETARLRLRRRPPSPRSARPDLDPAWERVILRCLERDPARRFATASEALAALDSPRPPVEGSPISTPQRRTKPSGKDRESSAKLPPEPRRSALPVPALSSVARAGLSAALVLLLGLGAGRFASARHPAAEPGGAFEETALPSTGVPLTPAMLTRQGWSHSRQRTAEGAQKSLWYFSMATAEEPEHAPAHAGLAHAYTQLSYFLHMEPAKAFPLAKKAVRRALELDPDLADAHAARGQIALAADWNGPEAEAAYLTAIRLAPDHLSARISYSELLSYQERHQEALAEAATAMRLEPLDPRIVANLGLVLSAAGRQEEAIDRFREALASLPAGGWISMARADALAALGRGREAFEARLETVAGADEGTQEAYRRALAALDIRAFWQANLAALERSSRSRWVPAILFARAHAGSGQREEALKYLELARQESAESFLFFRRSRAFASLADEPRYLALMAEIDRRIRPRQATDDRLPPATTLFGP